MTTGERNGRGRGTAWRLLVAAAVVLSGVAGLVGGAPVVAAAAQGAPGVSDPPTQGVAVVFPESDSVEIGNLADGQPVTVRLVRGGNVVASASGRTDLFGLFPVNRPPDPLLNHPYPPVNCWDGQTPNIRPGDVVQFTVSGTAHQTTAANLSAGRPFLAADGVLTVRGTAQLADGARPALASLELFLSRVGQDDLFTGTTLPHEMRARDGNLGRVDEADAEGTIDYDGSATNAWTARFPAVGERNAALALQGTTAVDIFWLGRDPAAGIEETVHEVGETGGTAGFCAAEADGAITDVDRAVVNIATADQPLRVDGVASDVVGTVRVGLVQGEQAVGQPVEVEVARDGVADDTHPWRATIPAADVAGLAQGAFKIAATFVPTNADASPSTQTRAGLRKDTEAPAAPTATKASGTYPAAISLRLEAERLATIRYTRDGSEPTGGSPDFRPSANPIAVTTTGRITAVAFDGAGNRSGFATFDYEIRAAPATGTAGPRVVAVSPTRNGRNVSAKANVVVRFDKAVTGASVRTVQLKAGAKRVAATVTLSADGTTITLNPRKALAPGTRYTVTLAPGIKDAAGKPVATQHWTFTTKTKTAKR